MTLQPALSRIRDQAVADLRQTRFQTEAGAFFAAGAHQFGSFWTRDFCLAVPGLLRLGDVDVVASQLHFLLSLPRRENLIARGFDNIDPKLRVLRHTVLRFVPGRWPGHLGALRAEHLGEHGTPAADSNALILVALSQLAKENAAAGARAGWSPNLSELLEAYRPWLRDGLVHQPPFSDWQDSARREGPGLFLHLCLLQAAKALRSAGFPVPTDFEPDALALRIRQAFADPASGLLRQHPEKPALPLESQLMILNARLLFSDSETKAYFEKLRRHAVWTHFGVPMFPAYPRHEVAWTVQCVGLRSYHDGLAWSWLLADQLRCAIEHGDEASATTIAAAQARAVERFGCIHEVYRWQDGELIPFTSALYRSEGPFTWGAARWIGAIAAVS